jgi:hypothetical protein
LFDELAAAYVCAPADSAPPVAMAPPAETPAPVAPPADAPSVEAPASEVATSVVVEAAASTPLLGAAFDKNTMTAIAIKQPRMSINADPAI